MASIITATTTSGLTQSADNSGVLQLASGTGNLVTVPSVTGTAMVSGNMPAFSAYLSSAQTVTANTFTKLQANTEEFDTANCYDNSINYRFTPNVAGYYQVNGNIYVNSTSSLNGSCVVTIYKNGSRFKDGTLLYGSLTSAGSLAFVHVSSLVYLNGSTDYVELYGLINGSGTVSFQNATPNASYFQAVMVRGA